MTPREGSKPILFHETKHGKIYLGDSLDVLEAMKPGSVDLIMTSPPFGLLRKKEYGNADAHEYLDWFRPFAGQFRRVIKERGSLVIDIGGAWAPGQPTRSLYHFKLLLMLCEEYGFHLAQEFYWWNPSKLPSPAEWVNIRRIRVKDAVNTVWWLSLSPWPRASNRRVLQPYSPSMKELLGKGYRAKKRPSGHDISENFTVNNGAAIPPNLIAIPNTESNSFYLRYCQTKGIKSHPARFPAALPEYFIRMLTNKGDLVYDPFGGSCTTGEAAEQIERRWVCSELVKEYLAGAVGRFSQDAAANPYAKPKRAEKTEPRHYHLPHPGLLWTAEHGDPLPEDGGKARPKNGQQRHYRSNAASRPTRT